MFRCCFPHGKRTGADAPAKGFLFGSRLLFQCVQHGPVHLVHPCRARFEFHAVGGELAVLFGDVVLEQFEECLRRYARSA